MTKNELRIKYKNLRNALSQDEIEDKSLAISSQLLKIDIWNKKFYHLFLSISENKEPNTAFIHQILNEKVKEIVVSKTDFKTIEMSHFLMTDTTIFTKNDYNIPEPQNGIEVEVSKIEVVFVPLLAYDKKGNRVGYGKGFYDKFLSRCRPETIKIGLSFFEPEIQIKSIFDSDIKLNYCVTPTKIYQF